MSPKESKPALKDDAKPLKITLVRSVLGCQERQRKVVRALGLKKTHQSVVHYDSPTIRGMVNAVSHLLTVEDAQ